MLTFKLSKTLRAPFVGIFLSECGLDCMLGIGSMSLGQLIDAESFSLEIILDEGEN